MYTTYLHNLRYAMNNLAALYTEYRSAARHYHKIRDFKRWSEAMHAAKMYKDALRTTANEVHTELFIAGYTRVIPQS